MKLSKGDHSAEVGVIGRGVEVMGDIAFSEQLNVAGKVTGKLYSESGSLTVEESGHLEAEIEVGVCIIYGSVHGNLTARAKVEIRRTARVQGDVMTPVLIVEEGATFNGLIKMGQEISARRLEEVLPDGADDERHKARRAY